MDERVTLYYLGGPNDLVKQVVQMRELGHMIVVPVLAPLDIRPPPPGLPPYALPNVASARYRVKRVDEKLFVAVYERVENT